MHSSTERAVERVIDTMFENLSEQLTVDDMARAAMFSKFHFTRVFQRVTGISPGRFLSAIRLQEAKRLLITTRLNVADISLRVGYNSVGTFSTRFTRSVGLSPTNYRRMGGYAPRIPTQNRGASQNRIGGTVYGPPEGGPDGLIFMGLFPHRIPEGTPLRCTILREPGEYVFDSVPDGTWYVLCHSVGGEPLGLQQKNVTVATVGPITLRGRSSVSAHVHLKAACKLDPPVLLALLDSRKAALERLVSRV
ncbi:helix-turn-helix domain-containing protein [Micromonospora sp. NPDC051227]|uniref:helix-turn-helix domain-containing protein n=1 Tax=Micromonospora sp. NPDC051227 TaxID=3364285 RepID=UPI001932330E|nr:helix-turn-helix transcriptional regulator [Micromonospora sp. STR1s_5]